MRARAHLAEILGLGAHLLDLRRVLTDAVPAAGRVTHLRRKPYRGIPIEDSIENLVENSLERSIGHPTEHL